MKKLIYAIGVSLFLAFMAFHVTVSLTNPYWGVSVEALAQGSGIDGSANCWDPWNQQIVPCISSRDYYCELYDQWFVRCDYYVSGAPYCSAKDQEFCPG